MGAGFFTWVLVVFIAGSSDRLFVQAGIPYTWQINFWRVAMFVQPFLVGRLAYRIAWELKTRDDSG